MFPPIFHFILLDVTETKSGVQFYKYLTRGSLANDPNIYYVIMIEIFPTMSQNNICPGYNYYPRELIIAVIIAHTYVDVI